MEHLWTEPWLARMLERLTAFARLIQFDRRGSGMSNRVPPAPLEEQMDDVLATVLFTDIVSSTERAAQVGDRRWRELLDGHHALVRAALAAHGGEEVKTLGDGFLATFDGPARAVRCALAIAERSGAAGIPVRAGIHTGEWERVGADVAGIAVHIAARVLAEAGSGQVLVSRTVCDLVAGSGLRFDSRGLHALRGVPGEWELFQAAGQPG